MPHTRTRRTRPTTFRPPKRTPVGRSKPTFRPPKRRPIRRGGRR